MKDIINQIAKENSVPASEVRAEMQEAIHQAFLTGTPAYKVMFGDREPSVEAFIQKTARQIKKAL